MTDKFKIVTQRFGKAIAKGSKFIVIKGSNFATDANIPKKIICKYTHRIKPIECPEFDFDAIEKAIRTIEAMSDVIKIVLPPTENQRTEEQQNLFNEAADSQYDNWHLLWAMAIFKRLNSVSCYTVTYQ
jgi:hypothetical protein